MYIKGLFFFNKQPENAPTVLMGIFINHPTPFINQFFSYISQLLYPKKKISIFIYNSAEYHNKDVEKFVKENSASYQHISLLPSDNQEWLIRNLQL